MTGFIKRSIAVMIVIMVMLLSLTMFSFAYTVDYDNWLPAGGSWNEESENEWSGSGGGNAFFLSDIYVSGDYDFTFEVTISEDLSHGVAGAGIGIFLDDLAPSSHWTCFQVQANNGDVRLFRIVDNSSQFNEGVTLPPEMHNAESNRLKLVYTASAKTVECYVNDTIYHTKVIEDMEGWLGLKLYEAPIIASDISFVGQEAPTPAPTGTPSPIPTATPDKTPQPTSVPDNDVDDVDNKDNEVTKEKEGLSLPVIFIASFVCATICGVITAVIIVKANKKQ